MGSSGGFELLFVELVGYVLVVGVSPKQPYRGCGVVQGLVVPEHVDVSGSGDPDR